MKISKDYAMKHKDFLMIMKNNVEENSIVPCSNLKCNDCFLYKKRRICNGLKYDINELLSAINEVLKELNDEEKTR